MRYSHFQIEHYALARREFSKIINIKKKISKRTQVQFSHDFLEFVETTKPISEGKVRTFPLLPFWQEIYKDEHTFKMIVGGRQIHKTTYITDRLAYEALSRPGTQLAYITYSQNSLSAFSRQKLYPALRQNSALAPHLKRSSNVGEISFKNGSKIFCTISNNKYRNIEGKTLNHVILDEAQYQPIEDAQRVIQTMTTTHGDFTICGIGGEAGSPYEKFWAMSSQYEWVFDDPDWRKKLQFDEQGLVVGRYLSDVTSGRWVSQSPENDICHGYHLSQKMFPEIPLTISDARLLYKSSPLYAIEHLTKNNPQSFTVTNILGEFHKSPARPLTPAIVLGCMNPYKYMEMLDIHDICELKEIFGKQIRVGMGVDFGSGNSSHTVVAVVVQWRFSKDQSRYLLAGVVKRPAEHQLDQAEYILALFHALGCDIGVGDLGYGAIQVKVIQDGGHSRSTGERLYGVGSKRFRGCRTVADETRPLEFHPESRDEHGDQAQSISIDKTVAIQKFVDLFGTYISHPRRPDESDVRGTKLIIPSKNEDDIKWLIDDFVKITRKDILMDGQMDPRQMARKEFNHPPDSAMAIIYAMTALEIGPEMPWGGGSFGAPDLSKEYFYPDPV